MLRSAVLVTARTLDAFVPLLGGGCFGGLLRCGVKLCCALPKSVNVDMVVAAAGNTCEVEPNMLSCKRPLMQYAC